jgi:type II secretory pathway pseudopilin PulG
LVSIVVIGLVVSALLFASMTATGATKMHRDLASADQLLRDHAEAVEDAVRTQCTTSSTYVVTTTTIAAFSVSINPATGACPNPLSTIAINVVTPSNKTKTLQLEVRSP